MSTRVTIYHNPRCGKSRDTLKLIEDKGIVPKIVEYLKDPPSAAELTRILQLLGKRPAEILRKKEAAEAGIDPSKLDDGALIKAMLANPIVIERPMVVTESGKAALGRPPESVLTIL
jgi:arsenate reductase (glutaredoxin)